MSENHHKAKKWNSIDQIAEGLTKGNFYTDVVRADHRFNSTSRVADPNLLEPTTRILVEAIIADAAHTVAKRDRLHFSNRVPPSCGKWACIIMGWHVISLKTSMVNIIG
jgi:hypothetical protein